jgi:hypothetical protein
MIKYVDGSFIENRSALDAEVPPNNITDHYRHRFYMFWYFNLEILSNAETV